VDWDNHVISYKRMKTGTIAIRRMDEGMEEILCDLPGSGPRLSQPPKLPHSHSVLLRKAQSLPIMTLEETKI
jgi:hypothetical protein